MSNLVFILPAHSLRFGGRWGTLREVRKHPLSYGVSFNGIQVYWFSRNEVVSEKEYRQEVLKSGKGLLCSSRQNIVSNLKELPEGKFIGTTDESNLIVFNVQDIFPLKKCLSCSDEVFVYKDCESLCRN